VGHLDADHLVHQHAADVRGGAGAARAVLHLGVIGSCIGGELAKIARRQVLAREQHLRRVGDQDHRNEIGARIVGRRHVHRLADRVRADRAQGEHVAVDVGVGDAQRAGDPAAARNVLDDHLLAQHLAEVGLQVARETIERAARRERNDHRHGPGRPVLGRHLAGSEHGGSRKREKDSEGSHHGPRASRCRRRLVARHHTDFRSLQQAPALGAGSTR
jgi:hypothetical protein